MEPVKVIVAQYSEDWVMPYARENSGIPIVIASNHPNYQPGQRFDYGFLRVALAQGYTVVILPTGISMTETEAEVYGQSKPIEISPHL